MAAFPSPAELLPHSQPMVLLDEVLELGPGHAVCKVTLRPDSMFVADGRVPGLVAIEYMAQAIGVVVGLKSVARGEPIRVGFLLGTREMTIEVDFFSVGDELIVGADHVFGEDTLGSFKCFVTRAGQNVAAAQINVFRSVDEEVPNP